MGTPGCPYLRGVYIFMTPGNYPILATPLVRGVSAAVCCVILSTVLVKRAILLRQETEFVELLLNVFHLDSLQSVCFTCLIYHCNLCTMHSVADSGGVSGGE